MILFQLIDHELDTDCLQTVEQGLLHRILSLHLVSIDEHRLDISPTAILGDLMDRSREQLIGLLHIQQNPMPKERHWNAIPMVIALGLGVVERCSLAPDE